MKSDKSWNSPGDRRFVRRFKEYWVDVVVVAVGAALIGGVLVWAWSRTL